MWSVQNEHFTATEALRNYNCGAWKPDAEMDDGDGM